MAGESPKAGDVKNYIANLMKSWACNRLRSDLEEQGYTVRQVDVDESLEAWVTIRTEAGTRMFKLKVSEIL